MKIFLQLIPCVILAACAQHPSELRTHHKRRPCGLGKSPDGRFLGWSLQYVDVSYNQNYNYNCGGSSNGISNKPPSGGLLGSHLQNGGLLQQGLLGSHLPAGGANRPQFGGNFPVLTGLLFGLNGIQSQGNVGVKPVQEQYDDVPNRIKPGQYITASNPLFGSFTQDITNFNPNKVINQLVKPFSRK